jgi:hypothetical protein
MRFQGPVGNLDPAARKSFTRGIKNYNKGVSTNESVQKFIENFSFGQKVHDSGLFSRTHLIDNHPIQISNFNDSIKNSKKKLKGAQVANNSRLRQNYFGQKENCGVVKTLSVYS